MPNPLTNSYQDLSNRILKTAGTVARRAFVELGSWRDEDVDRYLKAIETPLAGAKKQAANLQLAYYREAAKQAGQKFVAPKVTNAELLTSALRNGADTRTVYTRPFVDLRTALSKGKSMTESIEAGAVRAESLATTEIELARRGAGFSARAGNGNIVGYLRVLSGLENCALCYVASTQRYRSGDLMPIHPGCDCGEEPIYGDSDPGQVIDEQLLDSTHQAIDERFGSFDYGARTIDYRKAIVVHEHGELGPVLTVKGQHFTGPNDI